MQTDRRKNATTWLQMGSFAYRDGYLRDFYVSLWL